MTVIIAVLCAVLLIGAALLGLWQINRAKTTATNGPRRTGSGGAPRSR